MVNSDTNDTEKPQSEVKNNKHTANELIKNSIERRVTRSMKKLISKEEVSINAINALIIPEADRYKLTAIALKLHQSIKLTQSEKNYWQNFSKEEKSYIITGDSQHTLDFTQYQQGYFGEDYWNNLLPEQLVPQNLTHPVEDDESDPDPDLVADEPPFSESSEEENPVFRRVNSKDSGFNPVSDDSRSQQSARTTPPASVSTPKQGTSAQAFESPSSPEEFSTSSIYVFFCDPTSLLRRTIVTS